jgi:hypothetical protein
MISTATTKTHHWATCNGNLVQLNFCKRFPHRIIHAVLVSVFLPTCPSLCCLLIEWLDQRFKKNLSIQQDSYHYQTGLKYKYLRKKLIKCNIWSISLYGAKLWTLRVVDHNYLESFKMWCWKKMEQISRTDFVRNKEVLHESRRRGVSYIQQTRERLTGLVTLCVGTFSNMLFNER